MSNPESDIQLVEAPVSGPKLIKSRATKRSRPQPINKDQEDFAKMDPSIFALSLFRPLKKGDRRVFEVEGVYNKEKIKIIAALGLGAPELSVLLAIITLAGQKSEVERTSMGVNADHEDRVKPLKPNALASANDHAVLQTTIRSIMTTAGLTDGGGNYEIFQGILERLRFVSYVREVMRGNRIVKLSGAQEGLLYYEVCESTDEIIITISEHLSRVLITNKPFDMLWMPDYRAIKGGVGRILLTRLTVLTRSLHTKRYRLDDLIPMIYGEDPSQLGSKIRDRRRALRQGLAELGSLPSWEVSEDHRAVISVRKLREKGKILEKKGAHKKGSSKK